MGVTDGHAGGRDRWTQINTGSGQWMRRETDTGRDRRTQMDTGRERCKQMEMGKTGRHTHKWEQQAGGHGGKMSRHRRERRADIGRAWQTRGRHRLTDVEGIDRWAGTQVRETNAN